MLTLHAEKPVEMTLRIRGTYLTIKRTWTDGDRAKFDSPMSLRAEPLPDDPRMFAVLTGPIVLARQSGSQGLTRPMTLNSAEPGLHEDAKSFVLLPCDANNLNQALKPVSDRTLTYQVGDITLLPLSRLFDQRYSVYWRADSKA